MSFIFFTRPAVLSSQSVTMTATHDDESGEERE
jgi:hypothetical protein